MSNEREFLQWLNDKNDYYVSDKEVQEQFPNLEYEMVGVTKVMRDGEPHTPIRDWRQSVRYGGVID